MSSRKFLTLAAFSTIVFIIIFLVSDRNNVAPNQVTLPSFTLIQLKKFDGSNPKLPVYLALDGNVYDISSGREEFYAPGKPYHFLAGTDASAELKIAGGAIIKTKYPIIGTLAK